MTLTTLHVQRLLSWHRRVVESWGSTWVKMVNPPEGGESPFPNQKVDVRWWTDDIDSYHIANGYEGGVAFVERMAPIWLARPYAECYELANEPDHNSELGIRNLVAYSLGAMDEAARRNLKVCILNPPEASPHGGDPYSENLRVSKCKALVPAVRKAVEQGHYVGMHAYWRPGVAGPTDAFHALGHVAFTVKVWGDEGVDLSRLRLLVTETGIDGSLAGHTPFQGWRDLVDIGSYARQIAEAETYARQLGYVDSLMIFTTGYEPPWGGFNLNEVDCDVIGEFLPSSPPPPPPVPEDDPWIASTRNFRLRLNPDAALKKAIEKAGQYPASNEFYCTPTQAYQYGFANDTWYLWKWEAGKEPYIIFSERAERGR